MAVLPCEGEKVLVDRKKNVWVIIVINWDQLIKKSSLSMRLWGILCKRQIGSKDMHRVPGNIVRYPILHYFLQVFFKLEQYLFTKKSWYKIFFCSCISKRLSVATPFEKTLIPSSGLICAPTRGSAIRMRQNVSLFGEYSLFSRANTRFLTRL